MRRLNLLFLCLILCSAPACSTVTPVEVIAHQPSFNGNDANSGFIGFTPTHYAIVTERWVSRYEDLISDYGGYLEVIPNTAKIPYNPGEYLVTKEVVSANNVMLYFKNQGRPPKH